MHFNFITSLALVTSLTSNALAMPASDQSPNIQARATWRNWRVRLYTDDSCYKTSGSVSDNKETCHNLNDFSPAIYSIKGEAAGGSLGASNCGWRLFAFPKYNCEGGGEQWNRVQGTMCAHDRVKKTPIKSFGMYHGSPCN
jgi:hypothetical protein